MDERKLKSIGILSFALIAGGCDFFSPSEYAAEVGAYRGSDIDWEIWGDFTSLEECRTAAMNRYNQLAADKRAYSWACLLKNGKGVMPADTGERFLAITALPADGQDHAQKPVPP